MDNNDKDLYEVTDTIEHEFTTEKVKESVLLLKQKMCKTHDLIKQYTDKVKESNRLKLDLKTAKKETKNTICNYRSIMTKTRELELEIIENKQKNEKLTHMVDEYEITIAADKQNIQQLTCKIKEMEEQHSIKIMEYDLEKSSFHDKIKDLEHELKILKKSEARFKKREQKITSMDGKNKLSVEAKSCSDVGVNVSLYDSELGVKLEVQEKSIMTDEFYKVKDDPYPLFCNKCEAHLDPPPIEKICKIMSECPELIERNSFLSPEKISSPLHLLSNTHMEYSDKNKDAVPATISLSASRLKNSWSQCIDNTKYLENRKSVTKQSFDNIELEKTDVVPVAMNLPINPGLISATPISSQSIDYMKKDAESADLLAKHSSSIKQIKRKLEILESKTKRQLQKFKKKQSTNHCRHRCVMNYSNGTSLNSDLLATICKSMIEFYNDKKETCFRDKQDMVSEGCKYNAKRIKLKKRKRLNRNNAYKSECSWQIEHVDNKFLQDSLYNRLECSAKVTDTLQHEHGSLYVNNSNPLLDTNTSDSFFNATNVSDKFFSHTESAPDLVEATPVEDSLLTLHRSADEIFTSNNSLNRDEIEIIDSDYQADAKIAPLLTSHDENSIEHINSEIVDIIVEKNDDNLIETDKNKRHMKRKTQVNSCISEERDTGSYANHDSRYYDYESAKKRRIAHIPTASVLQSSIVQKGTQSIENIDRLEALNPCEKHGKNNRNIVNTNKKLNTQIHKDNLLNKSEKNYAANENFDKDINNIVECNINKSVNEENLIATGAKDFLVNKRFDIEHSSIELGGHDNNVSIKDMSKENVLTGEIIEIPNHSNELLDTLHNNATGDTTKDVEFEKLNSSKTCRIIQSESCVSYNDSQYEKFIEDSKQAEAIKTVDKIVSISELGDTCNKNENMISCNNKDKSCNDHEISKDLTAKNELSLNKSVISESAYNESHNKNHYIDKASKFQCSPLLKDNEIVIDDYVNDNNTGRFLNKVGNAIDKRGDAYIEINKMLDAERRNIRIRQQEITSVDVPHDNIEDAQTPMSRLYRYINHKNQVNNSLKLSRKKITYIRMVTDKFIKKQLQRLAESAWEISIHWEIIQKLASTCGSRIIAKCIVEFLVDNIDSNDVLDKSFTPPAPLMMTFEQKITALLVDLEISKPTVIQFVQAGIGYKLFKLNNELQRLQIESLTRIYVVLARIKKDREKVRIMCCDALYCIGLYAINLLYTVLTCWPEVLPNAEANKGILPNCIAFLIGSQKTEGTYRKLLPLKKLVSSFYNYSYTWKVTSDIVTELMTTLKTKQNNGLDTAIILIAKREGTSWTYKNIIRSILLPMIISHEHSCVYGAFSLLGKLMRTFPLEDKDNVIKEISEQFCDLIESGEGSDDQQEGVVSALLSLSRHRFDLVAISLMKWIPNKSLRPYTIAQIEAFIKTRTPQFWKCYLQKNKCIISNQSKT